MLKANVLDRITNAVAESQRSIQVINENANKIHSRLTAFGSLLDSEYHTINQYIPVHFKLAELVPEQMFETVASSILWGQLDSRILWTADTLRERYDTPCYVNTWQANSDVFNGVIFQYSGLRPCDCKTGAKLSQHKRGGALDLKFPAIKIQTIIDDIKSNPKDPAFKYITTIEETHNGKVPTWLHCDVRNRKSDSIVFLNI